MSVPPPTGRIEFRAWTAEDAERARSLWGDPSVTRFISKNPLDDAAISARLNAELAHDLAHGVQYWPIFARGANQLIGCCGLHPRDPANAIYELGFHLRPIFWGKGLATEASRAVIAHAFTVLHASALFAGHHPENEGSRRTLLELGFVKTHEELYPPTGLQHPAYLFAPPGPLA